MSAREHFPALEQFLHDQGVVNVLDVEVDEIPTGGYVVLYLSEPLRQMHRMPQRHEKYAYEFMARCVGRDARQARWLAERVNRFVDWAPVVPGWDCRRIGPRYTGHPVPDDDLTSTVTEIVSGYGYDAFPV